MFLPRKIAHRTKYRAQKLYSIAHTLNNLAHRTKGIKHGVTLVVSFFLLLLFFTFTLASYLLLPTSSIYAQSAYSQAVPRPRPTPFPCDEVSSKDSLLDSDDDEFHSLRPYQASPCNPNVEETALFCANDVILADSITVHKSDAVQCEITPGGGSPATETCIFEVDRSRSFAIDISEAELPIMGYTEPSAGLTSRDDRVVNSVSQDETMDDAEKMNEYVSWYLNGVNERAEYPFLEYVDPNDNSAEAKLKRKEITNKLIDFSGPIKKLLAQSSQWRERIEQIEDAEASRNKDAGIRHDQVAGCIYSFLGINFGPPIPCYGTGLDETLKINKRLSDWNNRRPPLEEQFQDQTFLDYLIKIREWRGQSCILFEVPEQFLGVSIPIIGGKQFFLCVDSNLRPNFWANLFTYIPYSSTEDRKGDVHVKDAGLSSISPEVRLTNRVITSTPADLFFAHMQEDTELADILQNTYVPKGEAKTGPVTGVSPSDIPFCDLTNIRSNPGDQLFAGEIGVDLSYTALFECEFPIYESAGSCGPYVDGECVTDEWSCDFTYDDIYNDCGAGRICGIGCSPPNPSCTKNFNLALALESKTPKVDEAWSRLVAGPMGIFKRIFPRVGIGGPILGLLDMPAATRVSYTGAGVVAAGNPGTLRDAQSAELYFPHIGGIYEYFLHGIQTALRPKGFGYDIISGEPSTVTPIGEINCDQTLSDITLTGLESKERLFQIALIWVSGQTGNHVMECYNDVIKRSLEAGVNPALAFWVWFNESNASNYDLGFQWDFGAIYNNPQDFVDQITAFFSTVKAYANYCPGLSHWQSWAYNFSTGTCDPNKIIEGTNPPQTADDYLHTFLDKWSTIIAPGCPVPSSPVDMSCPR